MAVGPIQVAMVFGFRSVAPFMYANPFNGGVMSWIGNPDNEWNFMSYVMVGVILCSAVWLIDGSITFFETRWKTATLTVPLFLACLIVLAEGGKFDPTKYQEIITVGLFGLAFFSTCGWAFAQKSKDKEDKKK